MLVLGGGVIGVTAAWYLARRTATRSRSSTASPAPRSRPRSPTAGRSRRRTRSRGPTRTRRSRSLKWLGQRGRAAALPPARRPAAVAVGPAVPARVPAVAHAAQHDPVPQPRALLARLPARAARADRHRATTTSSAASCQFYTDAKEFEHGVAAAGADARSTAATATCKHRRRVRRDRARARARAATGSPAASSRRPTSRATRSAFTVELARSPPRAACAFRWSMRVERIDRRRRRDRGRARARRGRHRKEIARRRRATSCALGSYSAVPARADRRAVQRLSGEGLFGDDRRSASTAARRRCRSPTSRGRS